MAYVSPPDKNPATVKPAATATTDAPVAIPAATRDAVTMSDAKALPIAVVPLPVNAYETAADSAKPMGSVLSGLSANRPPRTAKAPQVNISLLAFSRVMPGVGLNRLAK